ncbi:MAG: glycosyltransferase family 4 protein [Syntrophorhabdaceae bacterium]|nr:glycosyltransferase family 4 protein [Syntrophorhabdaceae bacterium]
MKKIVFLTHANPQGYRIQQYFPYLEKRGFEIELITTKTGLLKALPALRSAHVIYVQRLLFDPIKLALLRSSAKRLVYDFDDAVMFGSRGESSTRARKFRNMVSKADLVLAGNHFLLEEAKKHRKEGVFYVPTVVDTNDYPVKTHREVMPVTAGWIGSTSTLKYLDRIKAIISDSRQAISGVVFKVIADKAPDMEGDVIFERWTKEKEKEALLSLDMGIMPLSDDVWSKGKCGLKLIQYMAAGLPSVTHPVGVAEQMIEDGVNGFLRSDIKGWRSAIEELSKDASLRKKMGMAAREVAEYRYSLHVWGPRVSEIIDSL